MKMRNIFSTHLDVEEQLESISRASACVMVIETTHQLTMVLMEQPLDLGHHIRVVGRQQV